MAVTVSIKEVDTGAVDLSLVITMSVKEWKSLVMQLPESQALCLALKQRITQAWTQSAVGKAFSQ